MRKQSILIVDDEVNVLNTLKRIFRTEDYIIFTAQSAKDGLYVLEKENVDLIISDQKMPVMDGLDFFEKTIEKYPDVIRIILSGYAELKDALRAINKGCVYKFIVKPWNNEELKITLKRALEQRELILKNRFLTLELKIRDKILEELDKNYPDVTKKLIDNINNKPLNDKQN